MKDNKKHEKKFVILITLASIFLAGTISMIIDKDDISTIIAGIIITLLFFYFSINTKIKNKRSERNLLHKKLTTEEQELSNSCQELSNNCEELKNQINTLNEELKKLSIQKSTIQEQIFSKKDFIIEAELKYIDFMEGLNFEKYISELLEKMGYDVLLTKGSNDFGGDVIAAINHKKYAIQCKRYNEKLSAKPIGEALRAKGNYNCDIAVVITNNYFTENAYIEAKNNDVLLWDREKIKEFLNYTMFDFDIEYALRNNFNKKDDYEINFLLNDVIEYVVKKNEITTSMIQTTFKINYDKAGKIMDILEEKGIVSGYENGKPRKVLINK